MKKHERDYIRKRILAVQWLIGGWKEYMIQWPGNEDINHAKPLDSKLLNDLRSIRRVDTEHHSERIRGAVRQIEGGFRTAQSICRYDLELLNIVAIHVREKLDEVIQQPYDEEVGRIKG